MSIGSKLKIESKGMFATFLFYAVAGLIFLALLPMSGFPPQIGIIGIFSLIAAYGMFRRRNWTIWFVIVLFLIATVFSVDTLYYYLLNDYLLGVVALAYLLLTWVFTIYAVTKRKSLET